MTDHVRTKIRDAIVTRLTNLTSTGTRVYPSRVRPLVTASLPCLLVYLDDEEIPDATLTSPTILRREAELRVVMVAAATAALDETLDTLLKEVETALGTVTDHTFGNLIKPMVLTGINVRMEDGAEKPVGELTATFAITYFTAAGSPTAAI